MRKEWNNVKNSPLLTENYVKYYGRMKQKNIVVNENILKRETFF